jgi:hypothetical protein
VKRRIGEAWLLATGIVALVMLVLSMLGVGWSAWTIGIASVIVFAVATRWIAKIPATTEPLSWWNLGDLITIALLAGYTRLALAGPPTDPDFVLIWGVKGKIFFVERGIDWDYLTWPLHNFTSHNDYPVLLPNLYGAAALCMGGWSDRWLGAFNVLFGLAALLVVRGCLADEVPRPVRVLTTALLVPLLFSPYFGIAEGPLVAYSIAALLLIRRGETLRGAVYLGLAAFTKNEGLALIAAVALALLASSIWRYRDVLRLWPAVAISLPWIVLIRVHGLTHDLAGGDVVSRIFERVSNPGPMLALMQQHPAGSLLFWISILLACALGWRALLEEERFLAAAIALQFAFFIAAYLASPYDLGWHIRWSWERIVHQLMAAVALLAVLVNRSALPGRDLFRSRIS